MQKKIKLFNKIFCMFIYFLSFITFLSLIFNVIYLTPIYRIILANNTLSYIVVLICVVLSVSLTRLLLHLLADYQRKFLK